MIINPCKECRERVIGCHGSCEKYKNFREQLDKKNETIRHARKELYGVDIYEKEKSHKLSKLKRSKK